MSIEKCQVCEKDKNLLKCSRCKSVFYCGKQHQTQDWNKHKLNCKEAKIEEKVLELNDIFEKYDINTILKNSILLNQ
jgi:hypothetical protein